MSERKNTPFTNEHFAAFCESMVGQPYWYGTCLYKCEEGLRARKAKQYPSHYKDNRTAQYRRDIADKKVCADCVGGVKGYAWTNGGEGVLEAIGTDNAISSKYGSNGCPDKGANGMFTYAKSKGMAWGVIGTLPEIVGLALYKDGHVGYYIGNGYAVEWKGFSSGCVKTAVAGRGWTHWYLLPFIRYDDSVSLPMPPVNEEPPMEVVLGSRLLQKGDAGSDVKAMQELLMQLGYDLSQYGADGQFGSETREAVIAFQQSEELEPDGKYGTKTHAALMETVADDDEGKQDAPDKAPDDQAPEDVKPAVKRLVIVSDGGKVNVRIGNSTSFGRISSVAPGATFEYVATAANGWHAIVIGAQIGWVSGAFSRIL